MSIRVIEHTGLTSGEQSVVMDADFNERILIHPWSAGQNMRSSSDVYVSLGRIKKDGTPKRNGKYSDVVINRAYFVEAILAVFPELKRAE